MTTPLFRLILSGAPRSSALSLEQGGDGGRGRGPAVAAAAVNLSGGEWGQGTSEKRSVGLQKGKAKGLHCVKGEQKHLATQKCKQTVSSTTCLPQMLTNFTVRYISKLVCIKYHEMCRTREGEKHMFCRLPSFLWYH